MTDVSSSQAPFVVFGPSKSGTTWLQRMLDTHPESSCLFQPGILPLRLRNKTPGQAITRSTASPYAGLFSGPDAEEKYGARLSMVRESPFFTRNYLNGMSDSVDENTVRIHRAMVKAAITAYLDATSDKPVRGFKQHVDIDFLIEMFPDARIIVIVRDGRDVSVSMRHHRRRQGIYYVGDERWSWLTALDRLELSRRALKFITQRSERVRKFVLRDLSSGPLFSRASLEKAAGDWVHTIKYLQEKMDQYPDNHFLVKYEDLLEKPVATVTGVFEFIGTDASHETVRQVVEQTSMKKMKSTGTSSFFRKGISGDWKNVFTPADVEQFKDIAGEWLIRLGYEQDNEWTVEDHGES